MKNIVFILMGAVATLLLNAISEFKNEEVSKPQTDIVENNLKLGAFSMSLNVKDLAISRQFYEKLGFTVLGGSMEKKYLIMKNEQTLIGLFQGMFTGNILTFNPGWNESGKNVESFDDVRKIQRHLKDNGISLTLETDDKATGPGAIMTTDPDGNVILIDQHR